MELALPASLYGMTIVEPAMLDRSLDGTLMVGLELTRLYGMLFVNYCVILLFIVQLWKMGLEGSVVDCSAGNMPLELGCVLIFEVRMLIDIRRGLSILAALWWIGDFCSGQPKDGSGNPFRIVSNATPKSGAVMVREGDEAGMLSLMMKKYRRTSKAHQWKLENVSFAYRLWCAFIVGVPKLALDFSLSYLGGVYIMRSPNDAEMLMNTLAVVFIAEIDEQLYMAFTSDSMRYSLENMQAIIIEISNRKRLFSWFLWSILGPLFTVSASAIVVKHTRGMDCEESISLHSMFTDQMQQLWHKIHE